MSVFRRRLMMGGAADNPIADWVKEHMVWWYDVARQGATNESLAASPYITDLSGNGHDLLLNNFAFTESSGVNGDALVTDGVDDYGVVQNIDKGVPFLFMTCTPYNYNKLLYNQRQRGDYFAIYNDSSIAYNGRNKGGSTYINGILNGTLTGKELCNTKHLITIINSGGTQSNTKQPSFFSGGEASSYFASLAFYNSLSFDSIPSDDMLQDVIDYVIEKYKLM